MTLVGISISKPLADRYGERNVFGTSLFLSALCLFFYKINKKTELTIQEEQAARTKKNKIPDTPFIHSRSCRTPA